MRLRWAAPTALCAALLAFSGCGSTTLNPTPAISAVYPDTLPASGTNCSSLPTFVINLQGTNFLTNSVAYWNASSRPTVFNQDTAQLAVTLKACDISAPGVAYVTVSNPPPGGGLTINGATFQITQPPNPVPQIMSLSPASTPAGTLPAGGILTINGPPAAPPSISPAFVASSVAAFNGSARNTTFVSATELEVQMLASDVAAATTINVTVSTPAPGGGVANAQFTVTDPPNAANFPQVISVNAAGGAANGASSSPAMSGDGRYVAFYSEAKNLVASGASGNIFVRDTCVGATNCTPRTSAVDLAPDGSAPNKPSLPQLAMSADGRYVAFASYARNLIDGIDENSYAPASDDGLGLNVFVRDLCAGTSVPAGCAPQTKLASQTMSGNPSTADARLPSISADGRFVAFVSADDDLAPGLSPSLTRIFVRDTCVGVSASVGCAPQTFGFAAEPARLDVSANWPMISANGRYVAFEAIHHSAGGVPQSSEILLLDTCLGSTAPAVCDPASRIISVVSDGSPIARWNATPSVSVDGRFVAFSSSAISDLWDALSETLTGPSESFVRDTCMGATAPAGCVPATTMLQSRGSTSKTFDPLVDKTGRFVVFLSEAPNGSWPIGNLMIHDNCVGANNPCVAGLYPFAIASGDQSRIPSAKMGDSFPISSDGRVIAFSSDATNLAAPTSGLGDVFLMLMPSTKP
jgi:hypothetical protein